MPDENLCFMLYSNGSQVNFGVMFEEGPEIYKIGGKKS